jgi:dihydroorotate dehydrogenase (fumarate)
MDWSSFSLGAAAGFIKGPDALFDEFLRSAATEATIGSITILPREGNPDVNYVCLANGTSVNAIGLRNPGLNQAASDAPRMLDRAAALGKTLRWSFAGFTPEEYAKGAARLCPFGRVELNLGCPNVWGEGGQKPIAAFNLALLERILSSVDAVIPGPYDVKLSPYSDPLFLTEVAALLRIHNVEYVVTSNTIPNGIAVIGDKRVLDTPSGYGGIAGTALHNFALGQVSQFVSALAGSPIRVVGVGGVNSGARLVAMRIAGATKVQVGTAFGERKGRIFSEVLDEALQAAA